MTHIRLGAGRNPRVSIIDRIDQVLATVPSLRSGMTAYQAFLPEGAEQSADEAFQGAIVDLAAERYRNTASGAELVEFSDGAFGILFDLAHERTVLAHGRSKLAPPASRDESYHRGFPRRPG